MTDALGPRRPFRYDNFDSKRLSYNEVQHLYHNDPRFHGVVDAIRSMLRTGMPQEQFTAAIDLAVEMDKEDCIREPNERAKMAMEVLREQALILDVKNRPLIK